MLLLLLGGAQSSTTPTTCLFDAAIFDPAVFDVCRTITMRKRVGWFHQWDGRLRHKAEDLEERLRAQRGNTFGRRWYEDYLAAALAKAEEAKNERQAAALLEAVEAVSNEIDNAVAEDREPLDVAAMLRAATSATRATASIKHSAAIAKAIAQAWEDDEEEVIEMLLLH
jgi:hypothetical protein